jgi:general stress protein 26
MPNTKPDQLSEAERAKITDFLKQHPIGVLASVDPAGDPHATTIYFSVDDNLNVMFTTKRHTRKHENISRNHKVMLVVYEAVNQTAVQLSGKAVEVTDPDKVQEIFYGTLHAAKRTGTDTVPPVAKIAAGPYVAYVIEPDNIWMSEYGWGDSFANALKHVHDPITTEDPA